MKVKRLIKQYKRICKNIMFEVITEKAEETEKGTIYENIILIGGTNQNEIKKYYNEIVKISEFTHEIKNNISVLIIHI